MRLNHNLQVRIPQGADMRLNQNLQLRQYHNACLPFSRPGTESVQPADLTDRYSDGSGQTAHMTSCFPAHLKYGAEMLVR